MVGRVGSHAAVSRRLRDSESSSYAEAFRLSQVSKWAGKCCRERKKESERERVRKSERGGMWCREREDILDYISSIISAVWYVLFF